MTEAKLTWSIWQVLLNTFAWAFTRRGFHRFAEWITAMAINVEEHTITQSVLALERAAAWKALESFAEYGSWHEDRVTWALTHLITTAPGWDWHGYHVWAVDDTKVHRFSPHVWVPAPSTSTPPAVPIGPPPSCPQLGRPGFVASRTREARLVLADLRQALLPELAVAGRAHGIVEFRTKCSWPSNSSATRPASSKASTWPSSTAATPWGASCGRWPCPKTASRGSTSSPACVATPGCSPYPCPQTSAPGEAGTEKAQVGSAAGAAPAGRPVESKVATRHRFLYGRQRTIRWKEVVCLWRVLGWEVPVKAIVAYVEGYKGRFTLVTSAMELTGLQMVELFAARFRQEDGFRDLKQRLGWEECRAWTAKPIQRTSQRSG